MKKAKKVKVEKNIKPEAKVDEKADEKNLKTGIAAVDENRDDGPGKGKIAIYMIANSKTPDRDYAKDNEYNVSESEYALIKQSCITQKEAKAQKNKMMGDYLTK